MPAAYSLSLQRLLRARELRTRLARQAQGISMPALPQFPNRLYPLRTQLPEVDILLLRYEQSASSHPTSQKSLAKTVDRIRRAFRTIRRDERHDPPRHLDPLELG